MVWRVFTATGLLALALAPRALALESQLKDDYAELERRRRALDGQRGDFEKRMSEIEGSLKQSATAFQECTNEAWRLFWEPRRVTAEKQRAALEAARRNLDQLRQQLEKLRVDLEERRKQIESSHRNKGPGSAYDKEFREYMRALDESYLKRLDAELYKGYEEYFNGAKGYIAFLDESKKVCAERDFTQVAVDSTNQAIGIIENAWNGIRNILSRR